MLIHEMLALRPSKISLNLDLFLLGLANYFLSLGKISRCDSDQIANLVAQIYTTKPDMQLVSYYLAIGKRRKIIITVNSSKAMDYM